MQRNYNRLALVTIVFATPVFYTLLINYSSIFSEWSTAPLNLMEKVGYLFSNKSLEPIYFMRHAHEYPAGMIFYLSKFLYNRQLFFIGELFSFLEYFSPRFFFNSGDGTLFSPSLVEPIAFLFFPFWAYGLLLSIRGRRWKPIFAYFAFTLGAYLLGKRNFAFLAPTLAVHLYFIYLGVMPLMKSNLVKVYLIFIFLYGLILVGRMTLL